MPGGVYILCAITSLACTALLLRWSGLCFLGLTLDNVLLYVDLIVVPDVDLSIWRKVPGLVAISVLIFGLIWDSK